MTCSRVSLDAIQGTDTIESSVHGKKSIKGHNLGKQKHGVEIYNEELLNVMLYWLALLSPVFLKYLIA